MHHVQIIAIGVCVYAVVGVLLWKRYVHSTVKLRRWGFACFVLLCGPICWIALLKLLLKVKRLRADARERSISEA